MNDLADALVWEEERRKRGRGDGVIQSRQGWRLPAQNFRGGEGR